MTFKELEALFLDKPAEIAVQCDHLERVEKAKKHVKATAGQPLGIQRLADDSLIRACLLAEEFCAFDLEAW